MFIIIHAVPHPDCNRCRRYPVTSHEERRDAIKAMMRAGVAYAKIYLSNSLRWEGDFLTV